MARSSLKAATRKLQDESWQSFTTCSDDAVALITAHNCLNPSPLRDDSIPRLAGASNRLVVALPRVRP
jgi:hypothetical protein